ncbi:hypothetical protein DPEC_G00348380 [Dallia pectoralis]|uniref:Uncharacterized protein n=1 Tax=Dallia pectoralis TaxID=75939 RepID=A0ACC2F4P4_DALPE|nr:hypothetical protein DPEC_G00348380 [Dallia pectoralis]
MFQVQETTPVDLPYLCFDCFFKCGVNQYVLEVFVPPICRYHPEIPKVPIFLLGLLEVEFETGAEFNHGWRVYRYKRNRLE